MLLRKGGLWDGDAKPKVKEEFSITYESKLIFNLNFSSIENKYTFALFFEMGSY